MKQPKTVWGLATGLVLLATAACAGVDNHGGAPGAAATEENVVGGEHAGKRDFAGFVKRFDTNGNGTVEVSELPARMQARLAPADTNKDGILTEDEVKAHRQAKGKEHFARVDKNGDGALSADEVGEQKWAHIKVADADGDGKVTLAEMQDARDKGLLHRPKGGFRHGRPKVQD